jgi:hypothetical protein
MTDRPYQLDPFTIIKSINFGSGVWLALIGSSAPTAIGTFPTPPNVSSTVEADLATIAGGTPGFLLIQGNTPIAGSRPMPYTVTKADLTKPIRTSAGEGLIGFSVNQVTRTQSHNPPFGFYDTIQVGVYVRCSGPLSIPFIVRFRANADNTNTNGLMVVGLVKNGVMKAGVQNPPGPGISASLETPYGGHGQPNPIVTDFFVNPTALTVTGN